MKNFLLLSVFIFLTSALDAQQTVAKLTGVVHYQPADGDQRPMPAGASVFIPGIASTTTDDNGYYSLNLSQCAYCGPGARLTIKVNSDYGYGEKVAIVPKDPDPIDIEIRQNDILSLVGTVRDATTGDFLSGIDASAIVQHSVAPVPSGNTDQWGIFQITIRKPGAAGLPAVTLAFSDPNGVYESLEKVVFINQYEPIKVELRPRVGTENTALAAKRLAAQEVLSNIQKLDHRLDLFAQALQVNPEDDFSRRFDSISRAVAPGFYDGHRAGYRELITRSNIAALRQALNGNMLRQEFGASLTKNFIVGKLEETDWAGLYLVQFEEVQWAEESLIDAMEALADTRDTCQAVSDRVNLGWSTLRNRAGGYHLYALRLLLELDVTPPAEAQDLLDPLKYLLPRTLNGPQEFEERLATHAHEMAALSQQRAQLMGRLENCRDSALDELAQIREMLIIKPSDSWEQVIGKALSLRDLGHTKESIEAFRTYGEMFAPTDPTAEGYANTAIRFTRLMPELGLEGGLYVFQVVPGSHLEKLRVRAGDILYSLHGKTIRRVNELQDMLKRMPENASIPFRILRWDPEKEQFLHLDLVAPGKPLGGGFMPM